MKNTTAVGNTAETITCKYLEDIGFRVLQRNYKDRFCEIDIVCINKEYIVFVEVKYRARADYGGAVGAVTPAKLVRMRNSAEYWLAMHPEYQTKQPRLDVVTVVGDINQPTITHIEDCELY